MIRPFIAGIFKIFVLFIDNFPLICQIKIILPVILFVPLLPDPFLFLKLTDQALLVLLKSLDSSEAVIPGWSPTALII